VPVFIVDATAGDVPEVQRLARVIWHAHYPGIISVAQIDYMLERGYATEALAKFIGTPTARLLLAVTDAGERVGFAAWCLTDHPTEAKLDKLYVLPEHHGHGVGHALIERAAEQTRGAGAATLTLRVNKDNRKSIAAYRRNGFNIREAVVEDIGGGFVMDDYVMARSL